MGFGTLNVELSRFIANSDSEFVDKVDHVGAPAIGDDGHAERGGAVCDGSQDSGGGGGNYRDVVRMEVGDVEVASVGVIATPIGMELTTTVATTVLVAVSMTGHYQPPGHCRRSATASEPRFCETFRSQLRFQQLLG